MNSSTSGDETMSDEESIIEFAAASQTQAGGSTLVEGATMAQVLEKMACMQKEMEDYNSKVSNEMEQMVKKWNECILQVAKIQGDVEQVEGLSQTVLMLYQESSEEIRNLQSGFHELGNKSYEKLHSKDETFETFMREQGEKEQKMKDDWNSRFEGLEKEMQNVKRKQSNAILEAIRSALECMVCLEAPHLPLFVCPSCAKMIGCFECSSKLEQCANCRASLPSTKQPLRGLEALSLILTSSGDSV